MLKFDLSYIDKDGSKKTPVVIHRAILGSIDRFMAFYLEENKGILPLWLAPVQVMVMPVNSEYQTDYAEKDLDSDERMIFDVVRQMSGATMEEIISGTGFSPGLANSLVTVMEIKGVVESYAGRIYLSR